MALQAKLQFGDNYAGIYSREYLLTDYHCHFKRESEHNGPTTKPICDHITLTIVAPGRDDLSLFEWYINGDVLNGCIVFDVSVGVRKNDTIDQRVIVFEEARCFSLTEHYQIDDLRRRELILEIDAESVTINDLTFEHL